MRPSFATLRKAFYLSVIPFVALAVNSCDDDTVEPADETMPTSYDFSGVDYSGQTIRQDMLQELVDYMKMANTPGVQLDATKMGNMYKNESDPFASEDLNSSDKKLYDKTAFVDQVQFEDWMISYAADTQASTNEEGSEGTPGVISSTSGDKSYFFSGEGKEYTQLIEKGLMGAVFYNQIVNTYLNDAKIGTGVALADKQHHWDEAFGYLGMPEDYPNGDARFLGKYIVAREELLGSASKIMDAMIAGRFAINQGDDEEKNKQAAIAIVELEKAIAATAVSYINSAVENLADKSLSFHALSEAQAFAMSLKYNDNKTISNEDLNTVMEILESDFYQISTTELAAAKKILVDTYNLADVAETL
jgi:hypothetical protein